MIFLFLLSCGSRPLTSLKMDACENLCYPYGVKSFDESYFSTLCICRALEDRLPNPPPSRFGEVEDDSGP